MTIKTQRLLIEEVSPKDLNFIHFLHCNPEVDKFNTLGIPMDIQQTSGILKPIFEDQGKKERKLYAWIIQLSSNKTAMGICGMTLSADRFKLAEIYYNLHPDYWGKGYATETANAMLDFGFNTMGLHRIEAGTAVENIRSVRVLEKIGMFKEGRLRKILPIRGDWVDGYQFAILEDEFAANIRGEKTY